MNRGMLVGAAVAVGIIVGIAGLAPGGAVCPDGWTSTTGTDPASNVVIVSCTDGRYILTIRDGEKVAFDTQEGRFVPADDLK